MPTRVLVVDDEPSIRELLAEYLRGRGLDVTVAADGEQACAMLEQDPPDLLVTDLKLPGIDGITVLRVAAARDVPTVLMTGFGTVESAVEAFASGARDYLLKPFRLRDLHAVLERTRVVAAQDRRRAWSEAAMAVVAAAHAAREPTDAPALVAQLEACVGALPSADRVALRDEPTGEARPLGPGRWIEVPPTPEAHALVGVVHAALVRLGS